MLLIISFIIDFSNKVVFTSSVASFGTVGTLLSTNVMSSFITTPVIPEVISGLGKQGECSFNRYMLIQSISYRRPEWVSVLHISHAELLTEINTYKRMSN